MYHLSNILEKNAVFPDKEPSTESRCCFVNLQTIIFCTKFVIIFCQNCRVFLFLFVCFFKSIIEKSAWKVRLVLPIKRSELWFSLTSQYKNFESRHVHFFSFSRINVEFVCKLNPISDKDLFKKIDREVPRNYRARLINQASPPKTPPQL